MTTVVYGPDAFTVGANQNLSTYNTDWDDVSGAFPLSVRAATDDVRAIDASDAYIAVWNGTVPANQSIKGKIFSGAAGTFIGLALRHEAPPSRDGYVCQWAPDDGTLNLYRVVASAYTSIATGGTISASTSYTNCYLKATGTGTSVTLEAGDDTNGAATITFVDTDANRYVSGQPGLDTFDSTGLSGAIDDLSISDETPIVLPTKRYRGMRADLNQRGFGGLFNEVNIKNWFRTASGLLVPR